MDVEECLRGMTLAEKAKLCVGMNFWMTQNYSKWDIPSMFLSDGPHGLRKQDTNNSDHLGINESYSSVFKRKYFCKSDAGKYDAAFSGIICRITFDGRRYRQPDRTVEPSASCLNEAKIKTACPL